MPDNLELEFKQAQEEQKAKLGLPETPKAKATGEEDKLSDSLVKAFKQALEEQETEKTIEQKKKKEKEEESGGGKTSGSSSSSSKWSKIIYDAICTSITYALFALICCFRACRGWLSCKKSENFSSRKKSTKS